MGKKMCELKPGEPKVLEYLGTPAYFCAKCNRLAESEKHLCKPKALPAVTTGVSRDPQQAGTVKAGSAKRELAAPGEESPSPPRGPA